MRTLPRILILVLLSALLAGSHGLIKGTAGSTLEEDPFGLTLEEALGHGDVLWVDARPLEDFQSSRFGDAVHLTEDNWDSALGELLMVWDPDATIVVYCDGEACGASRAVARRLREDLGVETVFWLKGGWDSLQKEQESG